MDLAQWWSDNWQWAIGTVLAVLALVFTVIVPIQQRSTKVLDYEIRDNVEVLNPQHNGSLNPITMHAGAVQVHNPRIVTIRIINTGKKAIEGTDLRGPIRIAFGDKQPLSGAIAGASVQQLEAVPWLTAADSSGNVVEINPDLMNPGEYFDMQLVCDGNPGDITVTARFVDQTRPPRERKAVTEHIAFHALVEVGRQLVPLVAPLFIVAFLISTLRN